MAPSASGPRLSVPPKRSEFELRLRKVLVAYLHEVQPYIDFSAHCPYDRRHDHKDAYELAEELAKLDRHHNGS